MQERPRCAPIPGSVFSLSPPRPSATRKRPRLIFDPSLLPWTVRRLTFAPQSTLLSLSVIAGIPELVCPVLIGCFSELYIVFAAVHR